MNRELTLPVTEELLTRDPEGEVAREKYWGAEPNGSIKPSGLNPSNRDSKKKTPVSRGFSCERYWDRTSDLFRVREARYRCANRSNLCHIVIRYSRWRRDLNPCGRLCRPLPRLSATPPCATLSRHIQ